MGVILFDGIAPQDEIVGSLICFGIPLLVGMPVMLLAAGYMYCRVLMRTKIEEASARVLQAHPEFAQTKEDFRAFARKVMQELGWESVSFTYR
jgi:hypothetical protein